MADYLCLSATILTGRYHGAEWPPSPARLLAALLAGRMTGGYRADWSALRNAFEWLERQPPPLLIAAPEQQQRPYRIAAPNNDLDKAAAAWARGNPYDENKLKTMKTVRAAALPEGPQVHYLWTLAVDTPVEEIRRLAHALHTLGWGVDMAYAEVSLLTESDIAKLPGKRYHPSDYGIPMRVPVPGFLQDLEDTYRAFTRRVSRTGVRPSITPTVYGLQYYRIDAELTRPWAAFTLERLEGSGRYAAPWREAMKVAARLRHAASLALRNEEGWTEERINSYALGHTASGEDPGDRLSYLPLPTIGHPHADGCIRRVVIVEPLGRFTGALPLLGRKLDFEVLTPVDNSPPCRLALMSSRDTVAHFYQTSSTRWRTVTPVILHGHNGRGRSISPAKTEKLLLQAFEKAGYSRNLIADLSVQAAPFWPGIGSVFSILAPQHLTRYPRYHVQVVFRSTVPGPVTAGIGRHYGLGLFAAG